MLLEKGILDRLVFLCGEKVNKAPRAREHRRPRAKALNAFASNRANLNSTKQALFLLHSLLVGYQDYLSVLVPRVAHPRGT